PVTSHANQDEAWRAVARAIREAVDPRPPRPAKDDPALDPGTRPLPRRAGPAARLNARHEVVPFIGREEMLDQLCRWCEDGEENPDPRAGLIHAPGGMGKTRLVIELCKQMRDRGWRAGFLRDSGKIAELAESNRPALVALEYAESKPDLRELLEKVAEWQGNM